MEDAKALNGLVFRVVAFDRTARPEAICDFDPVTSTSRHDGITDDHRQGMAQGANHVEKSRLRTICLGLLCNLWAPSPIYWWCCTAGGLRGAALFSADGVRLWLKLRHLTG